MNDPRPTPDLLERYLAGLASEAEVAALARRIEEQPAFAEEFANACRLDACLSERFRANKVAWDVQALLSASPKALTRTPPARPPRRKWAFGLAAAAAVVAVILAAILWSRNTGTAPRGPVLAGEILSGAVLVDNAPARQVTAGAEVRTTGDVPAVVRLNDGSQTHLQPDAVAVFRGRTEGLRQQVELRDGSAQFEVSKSPGAFEVTTPLGRVRALGTAFSVALLAQAPGRTEAGAPGRKPDVLGVAVASGAVQVSFSGKDYRLAAGDDCLFRARAEAEPKINTFSGELRRVERDSAIVGRGGQSRNVSLGSGTRIQIETGQVESLPAAGGKASAWPVQREGTLAELKAGQRVTVQYTDGGTAVSILVQRTPAERREDEGNREGPALRIPEPEARMDRVVGFTEAQRQRIIGLNQAREAALKEINARFQADMTTLMTPEQKAKWDAEDEGERRGAEERPREQPAGSAGSKDDAQGPSVEKNGR